jgi:hypothetical protein
MAQGWEEGAEGRVGAAEAGPEWLQGPVSGDISREKGQLSAAEPLQEPRGGL